MKTIAATEECTEQRCWNVGSWRQWLLPPSEASNPMHHLELRGLNHYGMIILGIVGLVSAAVACTQMSLVGSTSSLSQCLRSLPLSMGVAGAAVLFLSLLSFGRRYAREIIAVMLLLLSFSRWLVDFTSQVDIAGSSIPLLILVSLALVAFRPMYSLLLTGIIYSIPITLTVFLGAPWISKKQNLVFFLIYTGVIILIIFGLSVVMFAVRWRLVDRLLRESEERKRCRRQTNKLAQTNRTLLEQRAKLLCNAQESKLHSLSSLVAGVVHELNTPLGVIQANASMIQKACNRIEQQLHGCDCTQSTIKQDRLKRTIGLIHKALETTLFATDRVSSVVRSLKNFAQIDRAKPKPVDLHEGIDSALMLLNYQLGTRIKVHKQYADLPRVTCDAEKMHQVFMVILENAARAIDGIGRISIRTDHSDDKVMIRIKDTGRGINPEDLETIFEPKLTHHGNRVRTRFGLATAYRIIKNHQGEISILSEPGVGTEVAITLPLTSPLQKKVHIRPGEAWEGGDFGATGSFYDDS